ncbi:MAG: class I SAM-dependent DNA methyltransferase, partial [Microcystis sp.]
GEANVHVSIVNWSKEKPKELFLDNLPVNLLSTALKAQISVDTAEKIKVNNNFSFQACELSGKGFVITEEEANKWIELDPKNQQVLKPMLDGKNLINLFEQKSWVIDFNNMALEEAAEYILPFTRVKETVKLERDNNQEKSRREKWWQFGRNRPA